MKRRPIDPGEVELWRRTMQGVTRSKSAGKILPEPSPPITTDAPLALVRPRDIVTDAPTPNPGLDRRTAQKLRRGQMPIEARLDLHGMTQEAAHRELSGFIARASASGKRVLLIITGKGTREGGGVLRQAVPRWLAEPALRGRVLATAPALPKDGGGGAFYLLLRRER